MLIASQPNGAEIRFDGQPIEGRTPIAFAHARDGQEHEVEFKLDGYKTAVRTIAFNDDPFLHVEQTLDGQKGTLRVTSAPSDLTVRLDGKNIGQTPLSKPLSPGVYTVRIGGGRYEEVETVARINPGESVEVLRNVPQKGTMAKLRIVVDGPANIEIDGQSVTQPSTDLGDSGDLGGAPAPRQSANAAIPLVPDVDHIIKVQTGPASITREIVVRLNAAEEKTLYLGSAEGTHDGAVDRRANERRPRGDRKPSGARAKF